MELSRDGDQAIRILPLIDFLEESGKPAEPHKSTIFGVSIDANILHRDDKLYKRSNYEQFGCSELFTHFPVILQLMKTDTETNVFSLQIGVESDIILIDTRPDYMLEFT